MKLLLLLVVFVPFSLSSCSQSKPAAPGPSLPDFRILLSTGKYYTLKDVDKTKPVLLIYFSPDCDHCMTLMKDIFSKINLFNSVELLMISFRPIEEIRQFSADFKTEKYKNIKLGTEGYTFAVRDYYNFIRTPFLVLYNSKLEFHTFFSEKITADEISKRIKTTK